jgi:AraC family transcriptional regulator, regulatory protein of adaptative response / methylated-DNA-[protein]-cysteine methyltransferase
MHQATHPLMPNHAAPQEITDADRWAALVARDPSADGQFLYSVRTTGVYCRPSCAARTPRRENVAFHASRAEAERAGFRPCQRCRPDLPPRATRDAAVIARACRMIETAETPPALADLAAAAGCSPHHFHRLFRRVTGVTPKAYADAHRQDRVRTGLAEGAGVTEAIYAAGFNSSGRFYAAADAMLGMTATAYRKGGPGETIRHAVGRCSLGCVLVAASGRGICAILLGDDPAVLDADLRARFPRAEHEPAEPAFAAVVAELVALIDDPADAASLSLPLDIRGTAFQRQVWDALRAIPRGERATYAEVAARIGAPRAVRAVASACAANSLAVAIPCHRVVASGGGLAGYRWGVERKRRLLDREKA